MQPDTRATKLSCDRPPVEGGILTETGRRIRCGHVMSTNPPQGHSNLVLTTVCGGIHQIAALTPVCQQPQYSGLLNSVNTKCSMSATSSKKPIFVQVFQKILKLTADRDSRRRRILGIVVAAAAAHGLRQRGSISGVFLLRHHGGGNLCCTGINKVRQSLRSVSAHSFARPD